MIVDPVRQSCASFLPAALRLLSAGLVAAGLAGCTGAPVSPPPAASGETYTTSTGATITVSGRVQAEGTTAR